MFIGSARRVAAWTSNEAPGEGDGETSSHGGDRVGDVSFGPDRRRLWIGNRRERQAAGVFGWHMVLRGEASPPRGAGNPKRRCTGSRDGENLASPFPRNGRGPVPALSPGRRAPFCLAAW